MLPMDELYLLFPFSTTIIVSATIISQEKEICYMDMIGEVQTLEPQNELGWHYKIGRSILIF